MLRVALVFFVLGIIGVLLGASDIRGVSLETGQTFLSVFLVLAVLSVLANLITGWRTALLNVKGHGKI